MTGKATFPTVPKRVDCIIFTPGNHFHEGASNMEPRRCCDDVPERSCLDTSVFVETDLEILYRLISIDRVSSGNLVIQTSV